MTTTSSSSSSSNSITNDDTKQLPEKKPDGSIVYPNLVVLPPPEVLPHLHASDTIPTQLDIINSETNKVETITQPTVVYVQKPKDPIQRHVLKSDIRYQVGCWFQEPKRAEFIKQMYLDTFTNMYKKKLSILLIDASDRKTIVPEEKYVRVVKPKQFEKLRHIVGIATMQQLTKLPSQLDNFWFPLILLHPQTAEQGSNNSTVTTDAWLQKCTYTSFVLIPFPDSLSGNTWKSWPAKQLQQFLVHYLMHCPPIEIHSFKK